MTGRINRNAVIAPLEMIKEGAGIWRKHGAQVSLWGVKVGEIGNLAFTARFDLTAKLGEPLDGLNNDPVMAACRIKNVKANLASWARSNQAFEIPI